MGQPRILVANDDGYQAEGIQSLVEALSQIGEVWMVAPDRERSATSHSISLHKPLRVRRLGERQFCVDGTPTDCVYLGLHHLMVDTPPDLIVSGINHGSNLGNDVLYSGTVSAAMEAALFGHRALAVSLALAENLEPGAAQAMHFATAAGVIAKLGRQVLEQTMPPGVLLNINVPNVPVSELRGIKLCRLGYSSWNDHVDMRHDPRGRPYYWIGGERDNQYNIADSDSGAVAQGYVAVTPVHYDVTDYRSFAYVRGLDIPGISFVNDELGEGPLNHSAEGIARRRLRINRK